MNIVNIIHIGDKVVNWDQLSKEEKQELAVKLNTQALATLGYVKTQDGTA